MIFSKRKKKATHWFKWASQQGTDRSQRHRDFVRTRQFGLPQLTASPSETKSPQHAHAPPGLRPNGSCHCQTWSDNKGNWIQTIPILFHLRTTLAEERGDSSVLPLRKAREPTHWAGGDRDGRLLRWNGSPWCGSGQACAESKALLEDKGLFQG